MLLVIIHNHRSARLIKLPVNTQLSVTREHEIRANICMLKIVWVKIRLHLLILLESICSISALACGNSAGGKERNSDTYTPVCVCVFGFCRGYLGLVNTIILCVIFISLPKHKKFKYTFMLPTVTCFYE